MERCLQILSDGEDFTDVIFSEECFVEIYSFP